MAWIRCSISTDSKTFNFPLLLQTSDSPLIHFRGHIGLQWKRGGEKVALPRQKSFLLQKQSVTSKPMCAQQAAVKGKAAEPGWKVSNPRSQYQAMRFLSADPGVIVLYQQVTMNSLWILHLIQLLVLCTVCSIDLTALHLGTRANFSQILTKI